MLLTVDYPGDIDLLRFSPQGTRLALAQNWRQESEGEVLVVIAVPSGQEVARYVDLEGVQDAVFRTEEELFIFHGFECWLCSPKRQPRRIVRGEDLEEKSGPINTGALSPDGKLLAAGASPLRLVDVARRRLLANVSCPIEGYVRVATFSPDGRYLAIGFRDTDYHYLGIVLIWDVQSGQPVGLVKRDAYGIDALAFRPDNRQLALVEGEGGGHVYLFDLDDPAIRRPNLEKWCDGSFGASRDLLYGIAWTEAVACHAPEAGMIQNLQFSPDGRILRLVGYGGSAVRLYARSGRVLSHVRPPEGASVGATAVSNGGLAAGVVTDSRSVLLWDVPRWGG